MAILQHVSCQEDLNFGEEYSITFPQSFSGFIGTENYYAGLQGFFVTVDEALHKTFSDDDACLLNKEAICTVVRQGSWHVLIDSHAQNADGCVYSEGTSVAVYHGPLHSMTEHVMQLEVSLNAFNAQFEVTTVKVVKKTCAFEQCFLKGDSSSDFQSNDELASSEPVSEMHEDIKFQTSQVTQEPLRQEVMNVMMIW